MPSDDLASELLSELRSLVPDVAAEHGSDLFDLYRTLKEGRQVAIEFGTRAELETLRTQIKRLIRVDPDIDPRTQFSYLDGVAQFKIKAAAGAGKQIKFTVLEQQKNDSPLQDTEL